ncbi:MAG: FAD-dependent oxidoreductase [Verrucomicrobia bacterium]|nr:FAD-dependent oxidoreductase [Verrucomicrobiota bacterium]
MTSLDLIVVGAAPAGIACSIAAAREGAKVLLLERSAYIGGLPATDLERRTSVNARPPPGCFCSSSLATQSIIVKLTEPIPSSIVSARTAITSSLRWLRRCLMPC